MVKTISLEIVTKLFDDVQKNSRMVGLIATPGNGKSTLIQVCCKKGKHRFSVSMGKSKKAIHIYKDIYQKLLPNARSVPNDIYDLMYETAKYISKADKKFLIALDESGKFKSSTLELFHELRDLTREKCGFIFVGPPTFRTKLTSWIEDERDGMEEFGRRIGEWIYLDNPTKSEKSQYCRDREIHEIGIIEGLVESEGTWSDLESDVDRYFREKK